MVEFRRLKDVDMWHWVDECSKWPSRDDDKPIETQKEPPTKGKPCPECRSMLDSARKLQKKVAIYIFICLTFLIGGFLSLLTYNKEIPDTAIRLKLAIALFIIGGAFGLASFVVNRTGIRSGQA